MTHPRGPFSVLIPLVLALLVFLPQAESLDAQGLGYCNDCQVTWYPDGMVCDACIIYTIIGWSVCENPGCYSCILRGAGCGQMAAVLPELLEGLEGYLGSNPTDGAVSLKALRMDPAPGAACEAFRKIHALLTHGELWDGVWYA